jgi:hypothetical protein
MGCVIEWSKSIVLSCPGRWSEGEESVNVFGCLNDFVHVDSRLTQERDRKRIGRRTIRKEFYP